MHHGHDIPTPGLRPISIDFTTQFDTHFTPSSGDTGPGTPLTAIPAGATVLMKDSAGTSMALNLDVHPIYGTPLLSGQAITARGDLLEVHPCSCNDPIASRHNLPMTASPEPSRGGSLFPQDNDPYASPSSLSRIYHTSGPARIRTPLVLVQTQLPSSHHSTELLQDLEIPIATVGPSADPKSPITPTPASFRRTSQTSSTRATYHTAQECLEEPSATSTAPNSHPPSQRDEPPRLNKIPTVSTFDPDLEMPTISSVSSVSVSSVSVSSPTSEISEPSTIGPLPSLPSSSSDTASERSPCTVLSFFHLAQQNQTPTQSNISRPCAAPQHGRGPSLSEVTPPDQLAAGADGTPETPDVGVATSRVLDCDSVRPSENKTSSTSTSDLYADRVSVRIPMPTTGMEPGGEGLQHDLTAQPDLGPSLTVCIRTHLFDLL